MAIVSKTRPASYIIGGFALLLFIWFRAEYLGKPYLSVWTGFWAAGAVMFFARGIIMRRARVTP